DWQRVNALQRLTLENDLALFESTVCAWQLERDHHRLELMGINGARHGERLATGVRDEERADRCHLPPSRFGADVPAFVPLVIAKALEMSDGQTDVPAPRGILSGRCLPGD